MQPASAFPARHPDADVAVALAGAGEPGGDQAVGRLGDGRGVRCGNGACSKMNSLNKLSSEFLPPAILDKAGERRIHRPMIFSAALIASARSQSRVYRGSRRYHAISAQVYKLSKSQTFEYGSVTDVPLLDSPMR